MKRSSLALASGLSALLMAGRVANAQSTSYADSTVTTLERNVVEGPGHLIGEGTVLHPHVSLETGVINNLFYEEDEPVTTAVARVIAGVSIASQNMRQASELSAGVQTENAEDEAVVDEPVPSSVDFRLAAVLVFLGYPSTNDRARDQTDFAGALDGAVVVNPAGDFSFRASDQFLRDAQPRNFESFGNLNRDHNRLELGATYRPGGGALAFGLRYENLLDRFESDESAFANRMNHTIGLGATWKYLPITKFYFDATLGFYGPLGDAGSSFKSSSMPLRVQVGVGTALTWATTLIAHLGYANGFYENGDSYNMAIGGLEFGYRYATYGRVRLVADYDYHDSLQANYFRDITLGARVDQQFGLFLLGADATVKFRGYRGIPAVIGPPTRDDLLFEAVARLAYLLRDNFAITARVRALIDETDYMYSAPPVTDSPKFQRYEGVVGATLAF